MTFVLLLLLCLSGLFVYFHDVAPRYLPGDQLLVHHCNRRP